MTRSRMHNHRATLDSSRQRDRAKSEIVTTSGTLMSPPTTPIEAKTTSTRVQGWPATVDAQTSVTSPAATVPGIDRRREAINLCGGVGDLGLILRARIICNVVKCVVYCSLHTFKSHLLLKPTPDASFEACRRYKLGLIEFGNCRKRSHGRLMIMPRSPIPFSSICGLYSIK